MFGNVRARRRSRGLRKCALFRRGDCVYGHVEGHSDLKCDACKGNAEIDSEKGLTKMGNSNRMCD